MDGCILKSSEIKYSVLCTVYKCYFMLRKVNSCATQVNNSIAENVVKTAYKKIVLFLYLNK